MGMMRQEGYNGNVMVNGTPVRVVNGAAKFGDQFFMVSNDGNMVVDKDKQIVGYIEKGVFKPMDAKHAKKLDEMGMTEQ